MTIAQESGEILSLDYDRDVSFANVENRLKMLIMNKKPVERFADM